MEKTSSSNLVEAAWKQLQTLPASRRAAPLATLLQHAEEQQVALSSKQANELDRLLQEATEDMQGEVALGVLGLVSEIVSQQPDDSDVESHVLEALNATFTGHLIDCWLGWSKRAATVILYKMAVLTCDMALKSPTARAKLAPAFLPVLWMLVTSQSGAETELLKPVVEALSVLMYRATETLSRMQSNMTEEAWVQNLILASTVALRAGDLELQILLAECLWRMLRTGSIRNSKRRGEGFAFLKQVSSVGREELYQDLRDIIVECSYRRAVEAMNMSESGLQCSLIVCLNELTGLIPIPLKSITVNKRRVWSDLAPERSAQKNFVLGTRSAIWWELDDRRGEWEQKEVAILGLSIEHLVKQELMATLSTEDFEIVLGFKDKESFTLFRALAVPKLAGQISLPPIDPPPQDDRNEDAATDWQISEIATDPAPLATDPPLIRKISEVVCDISVSLFKQGESSKTKEEVPKPVARTSLLSKQVQEDPAIASPALSNAKAKRAKRPAKSPRVTAPLTPASDKVEKRTEIPGSRKRSAHPEEQRQDDRPLKKSRTKSLLSFGKRAPTQEEKRSAKTSTTPRGSGVESRSSPDEMRRLNTEVRVCHEMVLQELQSLKEHYEEMDRVESYLATISEKLNGLVEYPDDSDGEDHSIDY